ncbi:MAG TPA: hypothetical protein VHZ76_04740 [Gammaproteobacteria bacterium]|jgi:hypothetical protein|nr:hypothetical protein [Gammaproteobacteria bacterium]
MQSHRPTDQTVEQILQDLRDIIKDNAYTNPIEETIETFNQQFDRISQQSTEFIDRKKTGLERIATNHTAQLNAKMIAQLDEKEKNISAQLAKLEENLSNPNQITVDTKKVGVTILRLAKIQEIYRKKFNAQLKKFKVVHHQKNLNTLTPEQKSALKEITDDYQTAVREAINQYQFGDKLQQDIAELERSIAAYENSLKNPTSQITAQQESIESDINTLTDNLNVMKTTESAKAAYKNLSDDYKERIELHYTTTLQPIFPSKKKELEENKQALLSAIYNQAVGENKVITITMDDKERLNRDITEKQSEVLEKRTLAERQVWLAETKQQLEEKKKTLEKSIVTSNIMANDEAFMSYIDLNNLITLSRSKHDKTFTAVDVQNLVTSSSTADKNTETSTTTFVSITELGPDNKKDKGKDIQNSNNTIDAAMREEHYSIEKIDARLQEQCRAEYEIFDDENKDNFIETYKNYLTLTAILDGCQAYQKKLDEKYASEEKTDAYNTLKTNSQNLEMGNQLAPPKVVGPEHKLRLKNDIQAIIINGAANKESANTLLTAVESKIRQPASQAIIGAVITPTNRVALAFATFGVTELLRFLGVWKSSTKKIYNKTKETIKKIEKSSAPGVTLEMVNPVSDSRGVDEKGERGYFKQSINPNKSVKEHRPSPPLPGTLPRKG